jgi:flagellar assembly protein FliH
VDQRRKPLFKRIFHSDKTEEFEKLDDVLPEASQLSKVYSEHRGNYEPVFDNPTSIIDEIKQSAFKEGHEAGFQIGFNEGLQQAKNQEQIILQNFQTELVSLIRRIEASVSIWFEKAESNLADLSFEVAKKIINEELSLHPEWIYSIAKDALQRVINSNTVRIRVNPFHVSELEKRQTDLIAAASGVQGIEILGDESLDRGSLIIESENGIVDARIETKFNQLIKEEAA